MIDYINDIPNEVAKKFVLRAVIGAVNGSLVGALGAAIRRSQPKEQGSGVDGYNEHLSALAERDAPYGLENAPDPLEVAAYLRAVKVQLLDIGHALPEEELPNALGETVDFIIGRPEKEGGEAIKQLAAVLGLPEAELEAARQEMFRRDKEWQKEHRDEMVAMENDLPSVEPETAFDQLPARVRAKIVDRTIKAIERQTQFAIQAVLRGRRAATSEVVLNRDLLTKLNDYVKRESNRDPEFAEMAAAA
jgi:hypothetical protein